MANDKIIWNYFKQKGLNDFAVAGLMGNIHAESGLNPINLQNSFESKLNYTDESYTRAVDNGTYNNFINDRAGYGLCQWTYWSRKEKLLQFAKSQNKSIGDLNMQLDFLYKELTTQYTTVWDGLLKATSIAEASNIVMLQFEKPKNQSVSNLQARAKKGQIWYDLYAKEKLYYRVQIGAFSNKNNAEKLRLELKGKGFDCIVKQYDNLYKCQIGAYGSEANAKSMLDKVKQAGYNAFITYR